MMLQLEEKETATGLPQLTRGSRGRWPERSFIAFLILYGGLLAWFCQRKVMAFDELLSFYTAHVSSVGQFMAMQRTLPVSLDPPLVHLAAFGAMRLGLNPVLAIRLPSLMGAALMVVCLFLFTRRLAGRTAAALAVISLLIVDQFHTVEARPYGLLLGLTALALLLWQNILRDRHRRASLLGLSLALGAAISSHYFGVLLLVPFLVAEAVRTVRRRRLDLGVDLALGGSLVFVAGWLPFLAGAHQYKANYYIKVNWTDLTRAYTSSFGKALGGVHGFAAEWLLFILVLAPVAFAGWLGYKKSHTKVDTAPATDLIAEWTAVWALALLPLAGVVLAVLASGAFEIRYVIEFTLGTTLCLVTGLMAVVRPRAIRTALVLLGCLLAVASLARRVRQDAADRRGLEQLATETATGVTVITDKEEFLWLSAYHGADPAAANRLWVADLDREVAATHSDNIDRTMLNLGRRANLPVISYADLLQRTQPFRLIVNEASEPVNWLPAALAGSGLRLSLIEVVGKDHVFEVQPAAAGLARQH